MSQLRAFAWDTRPGTKGLSLCPIGARAAERPLVAAFQIGDAPSALSYRCRAVARRYEILLRASMRLRRCRSSRLRFVGLSESSAQPKQRRRRVTALWALPRERKRQWGWRQRKEGGAFAPPSIRLICKGYRSQLNHAVLVAPPLLPFSAWPSRASLALMRHSPRATWPSRNPSCPR